MPDVNTRQMIRKLCDTLQIPILGLIDADAYGKKKKIKYQHNIYAKK